MTNYVKYSKQHPQRQTKACRDTYVLNNSLTSYLAKADSLHTNKLRNLPANLKRTRPAVS